MAQQAIKLNPALKQLEVLVGEWEMESPQLPGARGQVTFEWLEGGAFLVEHSGGEDTQAPAAKMVIGRDEAAQIYCMLYFDARVSPASTK